MGDISHEDRREEEIEEEEEEIVIEPQQIDRAWLGEGQIGREKGPNYPTRFSRSQLSGGE